MPPPTPPTRTPRAAWVVWGIGLLVYAAAVFQRSSLAVAGLAAQHRFHAGAAVLSLFTVLQLAVYAAMQVPVGVLLDRFGSRRLLACGAFVMAAGQVALALASAVPAAVGARVLVGAGDAMTFISVLRVVAMWFAPANVPLVTQLTGIFGQIGQIAAAYPLLTLLHDAGWTTSFLIAAGVAVAVGVLAFTGVRDAPVGGSVAAGAATLQELLPDLRDAWREPGTRLGLWTHFTTQFSGTVFALLWGFPFLVVGEHRSPTFAGALLSVMVVSAMVVAPLVGRLVALFPLRRSALVFAITGGTALTWAVVLAWPGRAPAALLVVLVLVLSSNGPGSMIGFDYARTTNPRSRIGSASGIVNVGGFVAALTTTLVIGVLLDLVGGGQGSSFGLGAFRVAFAVQYAVWAVGLLGVVRNRRAVRRRLAEQGVLIDPLHHAVRRRFRARSA